MISKAAKQARPRSGRGPPHQRAGRQGAVRPRAAQRQAGLRDERLRQGSARQGARAVPVGREEGVLQRQEAGHQARGIGVAVSPYSAGSIGFDGLFIIKPDGRITFQSGIGNHGTHSVFDVHRQAAEMLGQPWEKCDVDLRQHGEEPAVDLHLGRQPDGARDDARGARGGDRRDQEAAGDRRQGARRQPRGLQGRGRQGHADPAAAMTLRAGGAEGDRATAASSTATSCRRTSTTSPRRRRRTWSARA